MRNAETPALRWGAVTRHPKTGELGTRATIHATLDGWQATYHIDTHGKNSAQVAEEITAMDEHHATWVARLSACAGALDEEFVTDGETFRVVDLTIPVVQPGRSVRVVVGVARVSGTVLTPVAGFPRTIRYDSIADIPSNAAIISEVRTQLSVRNEASIAHETFISKVQQRLNDAAARRIEQEG